MIVISWADLVLFGFGCGLLAAAIVVAAVALINWWEKRREYARMRRAFVASQGRPHLLLSGSPDAVDVANAAQGEIGRRRGGRR